MEWLIRTIFKLKDYTNTKTLSFLWKKHPIYILGIALVTVCLVIYLITHHNSKKRSNIGVPIGVASSRVQDVPIVVNALGTVTPDISINVRTQVNGQILQLLYRDGQRVRKGQIIAQIDPRIYQAQLLQYQGQLERDIALLENAKLDLKRYKMLWQQNSISQQILDTQIALVKQYEGTIKIDKAMVDNAKLNLSYCTITSPIDGVIGIRQVSEGNLVQTNDTNPIAIIHSIAPTYIMFSTPETELPDIVSKFNKLGKLKVEAYDYKQNKLISTGTLYATDNQIDLTTGTIKLKAQFSNEDHSLFANQFINIKLYVDIIKNAITVPTSAIQYGPNGVFVYLVQDGKVITQSVTVGIVYENDTVITSGLSENQHVAVEGVDKLANGTVVVISSDYGAKH